MPDTGIVKGSAVPRRSYCPFCGSELLPGQVTSEDHIFGRALGAHVVVTAHKTCNNQSGSGPEGDLQRPNTLVNMLKAVKGLPASRIEVTFPSGRRALLNLTDGSVQAPPTVDRAADGTSLRIEGTPAQAEEALNTWRLRHPELDVPEFRDLPPEAIGTVSYDRVNVSLIHPLRAAELMAIKSALGACLLAYGSTFAVGEFAAALRMLLDDQAGPQQQFGNPALLARLDEGIAASASRLGLDATTTAGLPHLAPAAGETVHDVILVPIGRRTFLFAHYLSELMPPYGIVIDAPLPQLTPGMPTVAPILLRDGGAKNRLEVTDFNQRMMQPALDALQFPADGPSSAA